MQVLTLLLQTNWEEVARVAKFKTSKYARDQWTIVRNKLIATGNNATGNDASGKSPSPIKSPAKGTPGKRKRSAGMSIFIRHIKIFDPTNEPMSSQRRRSGRRQPG